MVRHPRRRREQPDPRPQAGHRWPASFFASRESRPGVEMITTELTEKSITEPREELYRQVWQEPTKKVVPRYGLSDVGLAKVCRKHHIPRPPVGYWAKAGVGRHVEPTPHPKLDDASLQEIQFFRRA